MKVWELSHERLLIEYESPNGDTRRQLVPMSDASFRLHAKTEPGGRPGDGARFVVRMRCTNCDEVRSTLERMVVSDTGSVTIRRIRD